MKTNLDEKSLNGSISLNVSSRDAVAWKLLMLFEAASHTYDKIEDIAKKYDYTREDFYVIKKAFETEGSKALIDKPQGPKRNYRLTKEIEKQIIRHRFLTRKRVQS